MAFFKGRAEFVYLKYTYVIKVSLRITKKCDIIRLLIDS